MLFKPPPKANSLCLLALPFIPETVALFIFVFTLFSVPDTILFLEYPDIILFCPETKLLLVCEPSILLSPSVLFVS